MKCRFECYGRPQERICPILCASEMTRKVGSTMVHNHFLLHGKFALSSRYGKALLNLNDQPQQSMVFQLY